jgi:membrane protein DedA with SNARE-associated domain
MDYISHLIETYGIYAVFALCAIEGDLTLFISGLMAHRGFFGQYSYIKVLLAGTSGAVFGDTVGYLLGRFFNHTIKNTRFYRKAQPRIERISSRYGGATLFISKYMYGVRTAICISMGACRMPLHRFLILDTISCAIWVFVLTTASYALSGTISGLVGDFRQLSSLMTVIGILLVISLYLIDRFWIAPKVEKAPPELIHKIEGKIHAVEEVAHEKFHVLTEKLHLTDPGNDCSEKNKEDPKEKDLVSKN